MSPDFLLGQTKVDENMLYYQKREENLNIILVLLLNL